MKNTHSKKIKVCWDFLAKMLGELLFLSDEEQTELGNLDDHDPLVLREIILEYVVPHYKYFPEENQKKIKNSLMYYLSINSPRLNQVLNLYHINLDPPGKLFYTLIWKELYGTDSPDPINPDDYEEDCSSEYFNSLNWDYNLKEKFNPNNEKPLLSNVLARIKKTP